MLMMMQWWSEDKYFSFLIFNYNYGGLPFDHVLFFCAAKSTCTFFLYRGRIIAQYLIPHTRVIYSDFFIRKQRVMYTLELPTMSDLLSFVLATTELTLILVQINVVNAATLIDVYCIFPFIRFTFLPGKEENERQYIDIFFLSFIFFITFFFL